MANVNKVILIGNLTRDPEVRHTPKGTAVGDIALAINRSYAADSGEKRDETTYVDVTLWGRTAEIAQQYLKKGRPVYIEGRLQMDTWEDKTTGQKRSRMKVVAESLQLLGGGRGDGEGGGGARHRDDAYADAPPRSSAPAPERGGSQYAGNDADDDIPF